MEEACSKENSGNHLTGAAASQALLDPLISETSSEALYIFLVLAIIIGYFPQMRLP